MSRSNEIAVLIPVHGQLPLLERCLKSLAAAPPQTPFDVVLVDDATPGGLGDLPERHGVSRVIVRPRQGGFTAAVNQGLRTLFADYEACVLLNSDMEVLPGCLDALAARGASESRVGIAAGMELAYEDPDRIVCGGSRPVLDGGELTSLLRLDRTGRLSAGDLERPEALEWVSFGIALLSRACWRAVGELDTRFENYFSDADYGVRANFAGFSVWYEPAARVLHRRHQSTRLSGGDGLLLLQRDREAFCRKWLPAGLPLGRDERRWAVYGMKSRRPWRPRLLPHLEAGSPLNGKVESRLVRGDAERRDVETARRAAGQARLGAAELDAFRRLYARGLAYIDFDGPLPSPGPAGLPAVVLAPHADDAALSLGGFLLARAALGERTRVHVLFGESGHATGRLAGLPPDAVGFVRAFEEAAYCARLGADFAVEPLPDRLLRHPGAPIHLSSPGEIEGDVAARVLERLEPLLRTGGEPPLLLAPLAAGLMADHAIVARAVVALVARGYPLDRVLVYDDLPYAVEPRAVRSGLALYEGCGLVLRPLPVDVTPFFEQKTELLGLYASQMQGSFLTAVERHGQALRPCPARASGSRRAERLWALAA